MGGNTHVRLVEKRTRERCSRSLVRFNKDTEDTAPQLLPFDTPNLLPAWLPEHPPANIHGVRESQCPRHQNLLPSSGPRPLDCPAKLTPLHGPTRLNSTATASRTSSNESVVRPLSPQLRHTCTRKSNNDIRPAESGSLLWYGERERERERACAPLSRGISPAWP